mgnify:CR=1 FL=1
MPFWAAVIVILGILATFGTPIVITKLILDSRRGRRDLPDDDVQALRDEVAALRHEMETSRADLTLALEDMRRDALPPADADE